MESSTLKEKDGIGISKERKELLSARLLGLGYMKIELSGEAHSSVQLRRIHPSHRYIIHSKSSKREGARWKYIARCHEKCVLKRNQRELSRKKTILKSKYKRKKRMEKSRSWRDPELAEDSHSVVETLTNSEELKMRLSPSRTRKQHDRISLGEFEVLCRKNKKSTIKKTSLTILRVPRSLTSFRHCVNSCL